jgi:hypothetical protein
LERLRRLDWHALAGIVAAVVALVLHLLHIVDAEVLLAVSLVLLALLLIRSIHQEDRDERLAKLAENTGHVVERLDAALTPPDAVLIGPRQLRLHSDSFGRRARGEMVWFNVCLLMFKPQSLFDALLRPAIENNDVTRILFILDERERQRWEEDVLPKVLRCSGASKVEEPHWRRLDESASFILADQGRDGETEAQLSFWGEPFMARSAGRDVPRYMFHVRAHSELIPRLIELERSYRLAPGSVGPLAES